MKRSEQHRSSSRRFAVVVTVAPVVGLGLVVLSSFLSGLVDQASGKRGEDSDHGWTVQGPDDFVEVASGALVRAESSLPDLSQTCYAGLEIRAVWESENRGEYRPGSGQVLVRVPATAARIEQVTIHELGHHFDAACPDMARVRAEFQAAQGNDHPWDQGPTWAETPAEQFSEALSVVVLGRRRALNVRLRPEAIDVVRRWAGADTE